MIDILLSVIEHRQLRMSKVILMLLFTYCLKLAHVWKKKFIYKRHEPIPLENKS